MANGSSDVGVEAPASKRMNVSPRVGRGLSPVKIEAYKFTAAYFVLAAFWFFVSETFVSSFEKHHHYHFFIIAGLTFAIASAAFLYIFFLKINADSERLYRQAAVLENRAVRAMSAFALVSDIDNSIMRSTNIANIYQHTCNRLVKDNAYSLVWIGEPDSGPGKRIVPICSAGSASAYLDGLDIRWGTPGGGLGIGLTGAVMNSMATQVLNNIPGVAKLFNWHKRLLNYGIGSTIAVPIIVSGRVYAVLRVYSSKLDAFHILEKHVFEILADHLSYTIRSVDGIAEINKAVEESDVLRGRLGSVLMGTITALSRTIEARDPYTAGHQQSVSDISVAIGQKLNLAEDRLEMLRLGALIHDIGKVGIPADILTKPSKLSAAEYSIIKEHSKIGFNIMELLECDSIKRIIIEHHERLDGSGYPNGLTKDSIMLESRIVSVADVVDSVTRHRPYRPALGIEKARQILREGNGHLFDPVVVSAFEALYVEGYDFVPPLATLSQATIIST